MINKNNVENYKICVDNSSVNLSYAANTLKSMLDRLLNSNICLSQLADPSTDANYTITIKRNSDLMSYAISCSNNSIYISCGGGFSANEAVLSLVHHVENNDITPNFSENKIILPLDDVKHTGDLRVMTSNILAERWLCGGRPNINIRAEVYAAILKKYSPDIVGVQETDMPWVELFPSYLIILKNEYNIDYSWDQPIVDDVANLTSILFLRNRFSMKEHGMRDFPYFEHKKYKLRVLAWTVLKDNVTNKLCSLVNTHWSCEKEHANIEIEEETKLVHEIESHYSDVNVFCTGDYNMHMNLAFEDMKKGSKLIDAKESAEASDTLLNHISGVAEGIYIDHVFTNKDFNVTAYETVDTPTAHILSDHLPQYGDFKL